MNELTLILLIGLWGSKEGILKNLKDHWKHFDQNYSLLNNKLVHAGFRVRLLRVKRMSLHLLRM
uniref:Uncharacterized protein n=1 Tax=Arundo donax TaxID=35708 RepID=A0A0A9DT34_ARUDO